LRRRDLVGCRIDAIVAILAVLMFTLIFSRRHRQHVLDL